MIAVNSECITMTRRCLLTFKPFRIFVAGIGFFSLCFLMTSLGGQFSAKRLGDSPFSIRTEVLGGLESRGVLRKISDMLEIIMKRIDTLSKMSNSSESHRLEELSSALHRFQPVGLVERIQAIAQNVSDMAIRMEQILKKSLSFSSTGRDGVTGQCEVPKDPRYPDCASKVDWMRARWTSDPCYAFYGVDGSDCSFLVYLSEVEWFCPPQTWRNQSSHPTTSSLPKRQAFFRSDLSLLLERVGSGKESLSFMRRRMRRLAAQWATAARRLDERLRGQYREQKRILVHVGFLTEESGDVFSPKVLKGGPLGEMVQWADILTTLHVLGHNLKISLSVKELQGFSERKASTQLADTVCHTSCKAVCYKTPEVRKDTQTAVTSHQGSPVQQTAPILLSYSRENEPVEGINGVSPAVRGQQFKNCHSVHFELEEHMSAAQHCGIISCVSQITTVFHSEEW
ncbi:alpha-1,6-mannosylglycoprotein 6-beta-N-acetylglucosaminyltransferase B [Garra rufa]|uniref:alpha-1,6-mannosylglycoprotein 6-beta-N-acetylglucosaminyltransferase B n=1 Tax=Garra rufa TaxID=137080 RepID=UPI003CCEC86A